MRKSNRPALIPLDEKRMVTIGHEGGYGNLGPGRQFASLP